MPRREPSSHLRGHFPPADIDRLHGRGDHTENPTRETGNPPGGVMGFAVN